MTTDSRPSPNPPRQATVQVGFLRRVATGPRRLAASGAGKTGRLFFRRSYFLTLEGWYYVIVLAFIMAGGIYREINLLMLLASILAGPLACQYLLVYWNLRRLEIRRLAPETAVAGQECLIDLVAHNKRRWLASWGVFAIDHVAPAEEDSTSRPAWRFAHAATSAAGVAFARVAPGQAVVASYRAVFRRRGRYRLGPIRLTSRFPFGLVERQLTRDVVHELIVTPAMGRLTPAWNQLRRQQTLGSNKSDRARGVEQGEFFGLRDWRAGDNRRWVHWRSSARRGSLVVRQFEREQEGDLMVLLDLWTPEKADAKADEHVEQAVSFVATIVAEACQHARRRLCVAIAGREAWRRTGRGSSALLYEVLEALAVAEPADGPFSPDLYQTFIQAGENTFVAMVTTRAFESAAAGPTCTDLAARALSRRKVFWAAGSGLREYFQPPLEAASLATSFTVQSHVAVVKSFWYLCF